MNKLKSLPKLASMGAGAIALSLSGIMLAPNNAAAEVCGFIPPGGLLDPCIEGGKQVRDIVVETGSPFGSGPADRIEIEFLQPLDNEHVFDVVYEQENEDTPGTFDPVFEAGPINYTLSYAIDILNDPDSFFDQVEIDSITAGSTATVTKEIFSDAGRNDLLDTIISTNGGIDTSISLFGERLQTLYITDTIVLTEGAAIEAYDNGFTQREVQPTPEPGTILGLLTVGGLGLGLKKKKQ